MALPSLSDAHHHDLPFNWILHFAAMLRSIAFNIMGFSLTLTCAPSFESILHVL